jgi:hypothetical protein
MSVPVSEFIRIQKNYADLQTLESDVKAAVRDLVSHASMTGKVAPLENESTNGLDVVYNDSSGMKVAVSVILNRGKTSGPTIIPDFSSSSDVNKRVILTDSDLIQQKNHVRKSPIDASLKMAETIVNIDRSRMADLLYFSNKYKNNQIKDEDLERALVLAKSIKIC